MILLPCPYCGPRNSNEFSYYGEKRTRPSVTGVEEEPWRRYLYEKRNPAGWTTETWYHATGCGKFFQAERHTVTNEVRATHSFGTHPLGTGAEPGGEA